MNPKILVVDDDESTCYLDSLVLAQAGYRVKTAKDGESAWRELQADAYDLLITDLNMPLLNGLALVERIRAAGMSLPVILDSASIELGEVQDYPHLQLTAVSRKRAVTELLGQVQRILPLASQTKSYTSSEGGGPRRPAVQPAPSSHWWWRPECKMM